MLLKLVLVLAAVSLHFAVEHFRPAHHVATKCGGGAFAVAWRAGRHNRGEVSLQGEKVHAYEPPRWGIKQGFWASNSSRDSFPSSSSS